MTHWSLHDLDIIGFSSVLEAEPLPRILAPIFQSRQTPDLVIMPPFCLVSDEVFKGNLSTLDELDAFEARQQVTRLATAFQGQPNHDLWVNDKGEVAYDRKSKVKSEFQKIFDRHLMLAKEKLAEQDWKAACDAAAIARAMNPNHLDPLIILGQAELQMGDLKRFAFTQYIATELIAAAEFEKLVREKLAPEQVRPQAGASSMQGIGIKKSVRSYSTNPSCIAA